MENGCDIKGMTQSPRARITDNAQQNEKFVDGQTTGSSEKRWDHSPLAPSEHRRPSADSSR